MGRSTEKLRGSRMNGKLYSPQSVRIDKMLYKINSFTVVFEKHPHTNAT
jgi:hypothetical protein